MKMVDSEVKNKDDNNKQRGFESVIRTGKIHSEVRIEQVVGFVCDWLLRKNY